MNQNIEPFFQHLKNFKNDIQNISTFIHKIQTQLSQDLQNHQINVDHWIDPEQGILSLFHLFQPSISFSLDHEEKIDVTSITNHHLNHLKVYPQNRSQLFEKISAELDEGSLYQAQVDQFKKIENDKIITKYKRYSVEMKSKVIELLNEGNSISSISRRLNIPWKNISRWKKYGIVRKSGTGRKSFQPEMEQQLIKQIHKNFAKQSEINHLKIRQRALQLCHNKDFKASRGWFQKFEKRFNLKNQYKII